MRKKIFNNFGLKILALVIAIAVWWTIVNIDDPLQKKTISGITVELRNTEVLTEKGYIYEVVSGSVIQLTVKAPQSIASELKASDFTAYADLSQLSPLTDSVAIEIVCNKEEYKDLIQEISSKTQVVKLEIDNKETLEFSVDISISGSPATDYVIGDQSTSPTKIQVTGAASVVERIERVVISYNVSDMTSSVSEKVTPIFYDANGEVVDVTGLQLSRSNLLLNVEILPTKWVSVEFVPSGTVAEGYRMMGYSQNVAQVKIAGTRTNLANISKITIPSDVVSVEGISEDTRYTVNIASYLSGTYRIVSETKDLIVDVDLEPLYTKTFRIPVGAIMIDNLAGKLETEWMEDYIEVDIEAVSDVLDNFNLDALNSKIDMQGLDAGEYELVIQMTEDSTFDVIGTCTVKIKAFDPLAEFEDESEEETNNTGDNE